MKFLSPITKPKQALLTLCLFFYSLASYSQQAVTTIYGDEDGFFTSSTTNQNTSDNSNNLLAFTSNGITFSTGVDDTVLTTNGISFVPGEFRALPIPGNITYKAEEYVGIAKNWGGEEQNNGADDYIKSFSPIVPSHFVRDGKRGLELSTNFFNIEAQVIQYNAIIINEATSVNDAVPDIIVTETGIPSGNDSFKFVDSTGNTVGRELAVVFSGVDIVGGTNWTIYRVNPNTGLVEGLFTDGTNGYRDLRALSFKLSDFDITTTNFSQVTNFVHTTSGNTDIAFTAYNEKSLKIELPTTDLAVTTNFTTSSPSYCNATTVEFTTIITNNSANLAQDFEVEAQLPNGITYNSSSATFSTPGVGIATATYDSSRDKWTIIELAPGANVTLKVNATINASKGSISYTATATTLFQTDTNTTNNSATISNTNNDNDCDGFTDDVDLDDDNDGILDADELIAPTSRVLNYSIYDGPGILVMSDVNDNRVTYVASGTVGDFDITALSSRHPSVGNSHYNIKYTGKIYIEKEGSYTFFTNSDDGSQLYMNNTLLVDNNGAHGERERSGVRTLAKGFHDIEIRYFNNFAPTLLELLYESTANGITKQNVPFSILTNISPIYDTDGDGIENRLDLDSDNDGISDLEESANSVTDANNDGMVDGPVGTDGVPDDAQAGNVDGGAVPSAVDTDGDTVKDVFDLDSDNDAIPDLVESGNNFVDANLDGMIDGTIGADGVPINAKVGNVENGAIRNPIDFDNDGIKDFLDLDTDNDGITDIAESGTTLTDTDNNGRIDGFTDANNNGLNDGVGIMHTPVNADGDTAPVLPNFRDLDSDNDGINDIDEAQNLTDTNGNGIKDNTLTLVSNPGNDYITVNGTALTGADIDQDGIVVPADELPNAYGDQRDRDTDGIGDAVDLDDDNDGILDYVEDNFTTGAISYEFYNFDVGGTVDNIPTSGAVSTGTVGNFDVNALQNAVSPGRTNNFAIRYKGKILIDTAGNYKFFTNSNDGSKLFIDGNLIVNNDGVHGNQIREGTAYGLGVGYHDITILYFEGLFGSSLDVMYQSPSMGTRQSIPFSILTSDSQVKEDKDNDGIINSLDTDSDNDGCPDAVEGGASFTKYDLDANDRLISAVDFNGVPVIATANGQTIGDSNNASVQSASCSSGTAMITQVYQTISNGKAIEITNVGTGSIPANAIKIATFTNTSNTLGVAPTTTYTYPLSLATGASVIIKSGALTGVSTVNSPTDVINSSIVDIAGKNDIIILTNAIDNTAWQNRRDVVQEIEDESSMVRIDQVTQPNVNYTINEWVTFVNDAITSYINPIDNAKERHEFAPLLSEVKTANSNANSRLGLHKINAITRTGGNWSNGFPDRSRSVIIDENYVSNTKLNARTLTVNAGSILSINDNVLVVSNAITLNGEIRLVNESQLIQTENGATTNTGNGNLLVDQNSAIASIYRYNYMGSPVNSATGTYKIEDVLKDGTNPLTANGTIGNGTSNIARDINFVGGYDGAAGTPISIADYWIYSYGASSNWEQKRKSGVIPQTDGFIIKGPGVAQNYTFKGTPKNGELITSVASQKDYLVANPYASSLSAKKFIEDNLATTTGTLYFWEHAGEKNATGNNGHYYAGYIGGYATLNLSGGVVANDVSISGPFTIDIEAENPVGIETNGVYETEGSVGSVKLSSANQYTTFKRIVKSVDTIQVRYRAPAGKTLQLKLNSTTVTTATYNLPPSATYRTFNIKKCIKAGTDVRLESIDTNIILIDKITLKDNDGKISCMPSAATGSYTYKEPQSFIPIGQGFFVQGDATGGNIVFNNSQRAYEKEGTNSVFYKSENTTTKNKNRAVLPFLQLGLDFNFTSENKYYHRQIGISFNPKNSFSYDKGYDSETIDLGATDMYWKFSNDDKKYVIAGVQEISENLEVPLGIVINYTGTVIIGIDGLKNIDQPLFLKDSQTNSYYNLREVKAAISLEEGNYENRFFLTFKKEGTLSTENEVAIKKEIEIYSDRNKGELFINNVNSITINTVELYNLLGQQLRVWKKESKALKQTYPIHSLPKGVYVVKVKTKNNEFSKKIIR